ncbi:DUF3221 domain-containing protein [Lentibacillus sp. JNUCC-1]|uniref:DUF3221 domain-containing protein n=1 Tax=Lentibacillus sp. JNUCC-1 TaxID=2654513 RepID=UPI0018D22BAF|nr:DUF3221 domain-containing protein [Lentibacillus sp. JNUCC-1]
MMLFSVSLTGCGEPHTEGIVIEADQNSVLVAGNLSTDRYKELKRESASDGDIFEAVKQEVRDTGGAIDLVDFTYEDANQFAAGDEVIVWIKGGIAESFPGQGDARKISLNE